MIWRLAECYAAAADGRPLPEPVLLLSGQGQVDALAMSEAVQQLVVCAGTAVLVFELLSLRTTHR